ncbi:MULTISPECIES: spondin domain-containing protein [unclassified Pseudoalteromonas]|uniref:spondin domain-containing protein n=1 Tax=unclassified Pseudoalteromonas TaxID=194690 RepID=UPI002098541E|nr:spondin domain-containing protein [Pseudoalteromonas sp. XMcav2-N]MCO7190200.1 spondin domain-containing protein [Pseudoalteromonas sp. XMcav2-N]
MKTRITPLITGILLASGTASAASLDVKITNLTQGIYFTPLLVSAHTSNAMLFQTGEQASEALQAMAEGGSLTGLSEILTGVNANTMENPAGGLLGPVASTMTSLETDAGNDRLSIVAMMLPTNDGFVGLNSWPIPTAPGTYHIYLNAYDAGTEANNELVVDGSGAPNTPGIPASPGAAPGTQGSGVTETESNTLVHIHRGNLGDDDTTGGKSDLHNTVHRWLNPVAKVTVTVK